MTKATILLVDDEPAVISSLKRALRLKPYDIIAVQDGAAALRILASQTIDLIISDNRMPGMDGPTLLAEAQRGWPDTMRVLLTGQPDLGATIEAINNGRIYRYISKPWDERELCQAIDDALAYRQMKRDQQRLQQLTHERNTELQQTNATLEARVQERTAELARTAEQLTVAHARLHRSFVTATEVFSSVINQRLPANRQPNREVLALVTAFCRFKKAPPELTDDLSMAAALYNIGKLSWNDTLIAMPVEAMDREQRDHYERYPGLGESLLMALEPAGNAAVIIRHHQERWDGAGFPDGLSGPAIPLGSRILRLAVDYVEMQMGLVVRRPASSEDVQSGMQKLAGRIYDPALCERFIAMVQIMATQAEPHSYIVQEFSVLALEPGMVTGKDLHANSGTLLLKSGTVLTERLIEKLRDLQEIEASSYAVFVRRPDPEELS
ncbi:HD domain-containing phosphohydrolase [Pollutimonas thiosulfatoxidans]|uniref:Two-component system response regulator n=1 Tax=Pollutimonas thiosulfatoxidans TaxID=2028345 RepID=A0A410GDW1_9BURK|nr:HD domain-containing phosphohydrolase [Pollutimonas thiosulfatoxidans]QAA94482.1 two-component system response regulator [Pollutimonas thiosulfatoxidans]